MPTREQLTFERVESLLQMIADDGVTPAGELPPPEHVEAVRGAGELGDGRDVAAAHREGRGPPDRANGGGN